MLRTEAKTVQTENDMQRYTPHDYPMPAYERELFEQHTYDELLTIMKTLFGHSAMGLYRRTFLDRDVVYKLPASTYSYDMRTNVYEYIAWLHFRFGMSDVPIAPCELIFTKDGVPIIAMARVVNPEWNIPHDAPQWCHALAEEQCAKLPNGKWVCYDAGSGLSFFYNNTSSKPVDIISEDMLYGVLAAALDPRWAGVA